MYNKWIRHTVERLRVERALPVWRLKINLSHRSRSQAILGMPSEPVPKFGPRFGGSAEPNEQIRFCVRTRHKIWELFCERQAKVFFFSRLSTSWDWKSSRTISQVYISFHSEEIHWQAIIRVDHQFILVGTPTAPSRLQLLASLST